MCPNAVNVGFAASRKTILLADDHVAARKSMHDVLLHAGHHILAVGTGQEALQAFAELDGAVDLLITDCVMPGMNGPELAETLRRQKPGLKVLLISGYEQRPVGFPAGTLALIRKPFSRSTFLERVIEIMQSPDGAFRFCSAPSPLAAFQKQSIPVPSLGIFFAMEMTDV